MITASSFGRLYLLIANGGDITWLSETSNQLIDGLRAVLLNQAFPSQFTPTEAQGAYGDVSVERTKLSSWFAQATPKLQGVVDPLHLWTSHSTSPLDPKNRSEQLRAMRSDRNGDRGRGRDRNRSYESWDKDVEYKCVLNFYLMLAAALGECEAWLSIATKTLGSLRSKLSHGHWGQAAASVVQSLTMSIQLLISQKLAISTHSSVEANNNEIESGFEADACAWSSLFNELVHIVILSFLGENIELLIAATELCCVCANNGLCLTTEYRYLPDLGFSMMFDLTAPTEKSDFFVEHKIKLLQLSFSLLVCAYEKSDFYSCYLPYSFKAYDSTGTKEDKRFSLGIQKTVSKNKYNFVYGAILSRKSLIDAVKFVTDEHMNVLSNRRSEEQDYHRSFCVQVYLFLSFLLFYFLVLVYCFLTQRMSITVYP